MSERRLLRVERIEVENLFNCYSHRIDLHLLERVTIIHGPNGVGKTVLLRLTEALLTGSLFEFATVPFNKFEVRLSDGSIYGVSKQGHVFNQQGLNATFYLHANDGSRDEFTIQGDQGDLYKIASMIENNTPALSRYSANQYFDRRTEEILSAMEVVTRFPDYLPEQIRRNGMFDEPEWMKKIKGKVGVHLIETQRLMRLVTPKDRDYSRYGPGTQARYTETVKGYAQDLQRRISETLTSYAKTSQSLDQSFPQRLLKSSAWAGLPVDDLKERMQDLESKRMKLKRIGLIEDDMEYPFDVSTLEDADPSQRAVMTLYVDDTAKKLGVLDDLARRIELMRENINRKFTNKTIGISRDKGFAAVTVDRKILELASLSSGEQHELVLLYDLLFKVKSNTLVLIDEPELSLHVTWQKTFLPDLLEIVSATEFDVVLATHSPFIVGDRNDLMVPLQSTGDQQ